MFLNLIIFSRYQKKHHQKCCLNQVPLVGGLWVSDSTDESVRACYRHSICVSRVYVGKHTHSVSFNNLTRSHFTAFAWSIYVPALTGGHELWVMTERNRSGVQEAKRSFLCGFICIRVPPGRLPREVLQACPTVTNDTLG